MNRIEQDAIGTLEVPSYAYYGIQTLRVTKNFPNYKGSPVHDEMIIAMAMVKQAAVHANLDRGLIPAPIGKFIIKAADEIISGKHSHHFIVDYIQGGASHSLNTNMNEVLANRSLDLMLEDKGNYAVIHPDHHVNLSQSPGPIFTASLQIACCRLAQALMHNMSLFITDALLTMKDEMKQLRHAVSNLQTIRLEATAEDDAHTQSEFAERTILYLSQLTGMELQLERNQYPQINMSIFTQLSSSLKNIATALSRLCTEVRQDGTTPRSGLTLHTKPEKINALNQIAFQVIGFNHGISLAAEAELNDQTTTPPLIAYNLLESLYLLVQGVSSFISHSKEGAATTL
ncbi:aspartate ammonia-lyase [Paenibacillus sp. JCM 10914]